MTQCSRYSNEEIEEGLTLLASLIEWYGDVYWPIFERLEAELEARQSKSARLRARLKQIGVRDQAKAPISQPVQ